MQDILFRGKRKDNGEWVYGYLFKTMNTCYIAYSEQFDDDLFFATENIFIEVIPETVGQFVQKINGVKIFNHDIVKAYKYGDKDTEPFVHDITFRNGTWWFGNWTWIEFLQVFRCVEVIGNIHDEPKGDAE